MRKDRNLSCKLRGFVRHAGIRSAASYAGALLAARSGPLMGQALTLRRQPGYDHSYWFIQSFIADHLAHHARELGV